MRLCVLFAMCCVMLYGCVCEFPCCSVRVCFVCDSLCGAVWCDACDCVVIVCGVLNRFVCLCVLYCMIVCGVCGVVCVCCLCC